MTSPIILIGDRAVIAINVLSFKGLMIFPTLGFCDMTMNYRDVSETIAGIDTEGIKTLEFSFASSIPHRRMDWERWEIVDEILDCREEAIKGDRLNSGLIQFLWNHDPDQVRGVISSIKWEGDRGLAVAKMSRSAATEELYQNVKDGIIKGISVGYRVYKHEVLSNAVWEGDEWDSKLVSPKKVKAIEWEIFEISAVSIPADATVGIGRADRGLPENLQQIIKAVGVQKVKEALEKMTERVDDIKRDPAYLDLDDKYRQSQADLITHKAENEALKTQVLVLQASVSKYQKDAEISQKYASLRSDAEGLVSETKMPSHEFDELFARSLADFLVTPDATAELRAIEIVVNMAKKRSAALNKKSSKIPPEMPDDTIAAKSDLADTNEAIISYENAWKQ